MNKPVVKAVLSLKGSAMMAEVERQKKSLERLLNKASQASQKQEGCGRD